MPSLLHDEAGLLARLRARDEQAFATLVEALDGGLRRLARLFVADTATAAEVVQDTWLAVIDGLDAFEGRSSLKTWVTRICVNKAKTRGVRESRHDSFDPSTPSVEAEADALAPTPAVAAARFSARGSWVSPPTAFATDPEGVLLDREARAALFAALATLPERQRTIIALRDLEGLGADEVCNILSISETNQRVLLHRARAALRAAVEKATAS